MTEKKSSKSRKRNISIPFPGKETNSRRPTSRFRPGISTLFFWQIGFRWRRKYVYFFSLPSRSVQQQCVIIGPLKEIRLCFCSGFVAMQCSAEICIKCRLHSFWGGNLCLISSTPSIVSMVLSSLFSPFFSRHKSVGGGGMWRKKRKERCKFPYSRNFLREMEKRVFEWQCYNVAFTCLNRSRRVKHIFKKNFEMLCGFF